MTVKITTPLLSEGPLAAEIVEWLPVFPVRVTELPLTGLLLASLSVTVIVEVVVPSARTDIGLADTVEADALTAPTVKVTVGFWVIVVPSVVSVAV